MRSPLGWGLGFDRRPAKKKDVRPGKVTRLSTKLPQLSSNFCERSTRFVRLSIELVRLLTALVNKVVFALMSGLPFKTSFKNGVELVNGFLDAAIDLVPA